MGSCILCWCCWPAVSQRINQLLPCLWEYTLPNHVCTEECVQQRRETKTKTECKGERVIYASVAPISSVTIFVWEREWIVLFSSFLQSPLMTVEEVVVLMPWWAVNPPSSVNGCSRGSFTFRSLAHTLWWLPPLLLPPSAVPLLFFLPCCWQI